jgi:hypothetical protein
LGRQFHSETRIAGREKHEQMRRRYGETLSCEVRSAGGRGGKPPFDLAQDQPCSTRTKVAYPSGQVLT